MKMMLIDIYLVTGFLGAGKTTLMKNLMKVFDNDKVAMIVNDFGQEGVDGSVLEKEGMVIEEIVDGSIFCVCRSDRFIEVILKTKELGINYLIVESSGLATPFGMHEVMGILHKLSPDTFHYSGSICVVDAKNFHKLYEVAPALKEQVQGADLLLLNKTDISTPDETRKVERTLRELNEDVSIIKTSFACIPDNEQVHALQWHRKANTKGFIVMKTIGIHKFVLKFDFTPIDQLINWLKGWAENVYRVKGFCLDNNKQYYLQAVHEDVTVSEIHNGRKENFLVVLGPARDQIKEDIKSSWFEHFKTTISIC